MTLIFSWDLLPVMSWATSGNKWVYNVPGVRSTNGNRRIINYKNVSSPATSLLHLTVRLMLICLRVVFNISCSTMRCPPVTFILSGNTTIQRIWHKGKTRVELLHDSKFLILCSGSITRRLKLREACWVCNWDMFVGRN